MIIKHFVPLNKNFPHNFLALKIITYKKCMIKEKLKKDIFIMIDDNKIIKNSIKT